MELGGDWHPVKLTGVNYSPPNSWGRGSMNMQVTTQVCEVAIGQRYDVGEWSFVDDRGDPAPKTGRELLEDLGLRTTTQARIEEQKKQMIRAEQLRGKNGLVLDCSASVLAPNKMMWRTSLDKCRLGVEGKPRQIIIENELEIDQQHRHGYQYGQQQVQHELPFVRAFSVDLKKYVYAHVEDVREHVFAGDARARLCLPEDMHAVLNNIFDTPTELMFGDMFLGRHGGMVVLANGPTGTGKTLTAEVFAEHTKRPLYIMEMGELGTNLSSVEENLQKIFARASRWNAVLLFDECDVFLAKREETNLERSAIVGVFLRLLDRYEGMFFLTSNRGDVIDPAFKGRITLKLDYPELEPSRRVTIWKNMLEAASIVVDGDLTAIAEEPLNGRQIRNQVRLLKIMNPKGRVSVGDVMKSLRYVTK
jgi:ATPase family associated with various cellular activities (AAA)